jgi:hypothetical protein
MSTMTQSPHGSIPGITDIYTPPDQTVSKVLYLSATGVTVHNNSHLDPTPETFRIMHDGRTTVIAPGQARMISIAALFHWFGDPHSGAEEYKLTDPLGGFRWVPTRLSECNRMRSIHKWDIGVDDSLLAVHPVPSFQIFDDEGNEVHTPCTDPEGAKTATVSALAAQSTYDVTEQIAILTRQVQLLQKRLTGAEVDSAFGVPGPTYDDTVPPPPDDNSLEPPTDDPQVGLPSPARARRG